ncbi:cytochrome P450 [Cristinia sonorae]|uniref:Cytochrome P450 n=1 Tax=Cristinia sonorae TaxID=1940300 RepID=A0A8K0XPJ2_9AGAR|nr:cytochrome P450 [Cristinia sonorae]
MTPIVQGAAICVFSIIAWQVLRKIFSRSSFDNVRGPPASSFWQGHYPDFFDRHSWNFHRSLSEKYGSVVALRGLFNKKMLYLHDPKAMHHICVKDQAVYEESSGFLTTTRIMFGDGLLSSNGDHHRRQRKMLNPVFSINHMRRMVPVFNTVSQRLKTAMTASLQKSPKGEIDISFWMSRMALELIGQAGLGYSFDPLVEDTPNAFAAALKSLPSALQPFQPFREIVPLIYNTFPHSFLERIVKALPFQSVQKAWKISNTMETVSKEILAGKRAAIAAGDEAVTAQVGEGRDLISILMNENSKTSEQERISDEELLGHMSVFTSAATDTTSSALTRTMYMLAEHPDVQAKLRKELQEAHADGRELSYDELVALPYMDAVCRETLRLHAPVPFMSRVARKDAILPLHTPIRGKDGQMIDEIAIPNGTLIYLDILGSNRDPLIWGEDAHEWKPERWLSPLPESVLEARIPGIYSHLMTFLAGGRACIGFKFSQLEMKVVLAMLVMNFSFELPKDKEIYWNFSGIVYPTVGSVDTKMQLPLQVSVVKQAA